MKLPRDLSGADLARALAKEGHVPLKVGTLAAILAEVAQQLQTDRDTLLARLKL